MEQTQNTLSGRISEARAMREMLLTDRHRPGYHIVAPEGICAPFDPNGALFWRGRYHLMYIVQTEKGHCWAHISSHDLIHWRHHPMALEPGGIDSGIFSGGAFVDQNGVPTITYWGLGDKAGICTATSHDDNLDHWIKSPHNPIIHQTELGLAKGEDGRVYGAADPSAIWEKDGRYYLLTGNLLVLRKYGLDQGMTEHQGDTAYLFMSDNLTHWQYLHPFYSSDRCWTQANEDCMCPDFFPLGDRHMLLFISHNLGCQYYIGRYVNDHFYPESHERMTWIDNAFFAPESLLDHRGRRIMWAWIFDGREAETRQASGWSGTMSLPRVLWLNETHQLCMAPIEELAMLRGKKRSGPKVRVPADSERIMDNLSGNSLELEIEIEPGEASSFGVTVCRSRDGQEQTRIGYDALNQTLFVDTTRSSLGEGPKSVEAGPLALGQGEPLRLRVFIDRSVVEVFANEKQAIMRRIYPTQGDSLGVSVWCKGGDITIRYVSAWEMAAANSW